MTGPHRNPAALSALLFLLALPVVGAVAAATPRSDNCTATLLRTCSRTTTVQLCDACVGTHQSALRQARCGSADVQGYCRSARPLPSCKRPAPPPGPGPPAPAPPAPHPDPESYASHVVLGAGATLYYTVNEPKAGDAGRDPTISFLLHVGPSKEAADEPGGRPIAWLGLGLSPTGAMKDGSFVIGYSGCVRVTSLSGAQSDRPPNGPAGFAATQASFSRDDDGAWLAFTRPLRDRLPGHVSIDGETTLNFLYAASSSAPAAGKCAIPLDMSNIHDITHGSKAVPPHDLDLTARPAAAALPPSPPPPPLTFSRHGAERIVHTGVRHPSTGRAYAVVEQAFTSSPMYLRNGEVAWTDMQTTVIPMPTGGDYAILKMRGEVIDCNNVSVPLTTVYNHHWVMRPIRGPTKFEDKACPDASFSYVFGVGAESRDTLTAFPPGYGYKVKDGTVWGANIHLLHTQGLTGGQQGIKECIECWATPFRQRHGCEPSRNGSFGCCGAGRAAGTCQTVLPDLVPTEYSLRMYITYTRDVAAISPLDISVFRAPNCQYEYNVGDQPSVQSGDVNMVEDQWVMPRREELMFAIAHLHTGAINLTASVQKTGSGRFEPVCTSYPVYGKNGTTPGDEAGHIVKMTYCLSSDGNDGGIPPELRGGFRNTSLVLERGDTLRIRGYYATGLLDPRIAPVPAGAHLGVMSFLYVAFASQEEAGAGAAQPAFFQRRGRALGHP